MESSSEPPLREDLETCSRAEYNESLCRPVTNNVNLFTKRTHDARPIAHAVIQIHTLNSPTVTL